ncbi:MAG: carboxypeptidase regulatory-like domain-containing protein, partial [Kiritimatiellae bacterium]|nr:carboxypeptidase regulatory-like domain-containing protein [Kiritimatiellia bacterium]
MKTVKEMIAMTFAAVATSTILPALGGDSSPFLLDTADGTRIAAEGEAIPVAYSPRWGNAASCMVTTAGAPSLRTDEGEIIWTPQGIGGHTLTHTAGDLTYTAQFAVLGDDVAVAGGRLSSSTVWAADKTHLVTAPLTVPSGVSLTIEPGAVVKFMPGASLMVESGGNCTAKGAIFTHVNDDTAGGDTLYDGDSAAPKMGEYTIIGNIVDDDTTEYRYMPPQTLQSNVSSNTRLRGYRTYIVSNSVTVASGATLTLQPGTILKFNTGCSLTVNGTLDAQGTRAAPIVFTSLKDDAHGGDTNGDGEKTLPDANDWRSIYVSGKASFSFAEILYGGGTSSSSDSGVLVGNSGGTISLANTTIAHAMYDGIFSRATVTGENMIIHDCDRGINTCGGSGVFKNCVIDRCRWGVMAEGGSGTYYNCIITRFYGSTSWPTGWGVAYWSGSLKTYNCCVYSTLSGASNYRSSPMTVNNIIADPLFEDADNMNFRIAANSPCVDAGDGTVAPELDYWGQPRMDVKRVKDTGAPNCDGVCPDIGIYEVPGAANVPLPDLAVVGGPTAVSATAGTGGPDGAGPSLAPGDTLTVTYTVTNRGAAAVSGLVRDLFRFTGADAATAGLTVEAAEIEQAYNVPTGGCATLTATLTVPTLKAGTWKVEVGVNVGNYPYEQNLSNNRATSENAISIDLEALGFGTRSVTVGTGESAGFVLSGLPTAGGVVRVTGASDAVTAYGGNGSMPTAGATSAPLPGGGCGATALPTVPLADGSLLIVFPERAAGESAYLVLENGGGAAATVSVEVKAAELALYGAAPGRIANVGEATVTITGSGLDAAATVTLGGRTAKRVEALNAAQIAATFDVDGMAAGTYGVTVEAVATSATLPDAVEVYAAKTGPKLRAWLEMPSSVRDGRVFTGYVCYANEGDSPMTMPVFKVARQDSSTKMGLVASESMTETTLYVGGISPTHPAGVLKAGDAARIPFYFQPFGTYRIKLTHIKDAEDLAAYPTFGGTKAYLAAMSAAATRINLRGRTAYNVHDFVDQALWEKNGVAHAAVSGYLVDAKTGEPLANANVSLVDAGGLRSVATDPDATDASLPPATGTTDENGYFQLTNLADGEYRWLLDDGNTLADASTNMVTIAGQADLNGVTVSATPGGRISGYVLTATGGPVDYGTVALLDADGMVSTAVETDGFGAFSFKGLSDGTYSVRSMPKDGYMADTVTNIVIDAAARSAEVMFELEKGARLGGTVTFNGVAVTNGTVQAIMTDGTSYEVLCATNGVYLFDGLAAGNYAVRYYAKTALSEDVDVTLSVGDDKAVDLAANERPLFISTRTVGFGSCEAKFIFIDPARAEKVSTWAWDFDSDGVVDSTDASPTWNYTKLGTNTVTLVITEDGKQTTSVYRNCVRVEQALETVLADNAILFGTNSGTLQAVSMGEGTLVLSGNPASGTLAPGMVLMGQCGEDWFCRRIVSANQSGGKWMLTTEGADWDDVYEQVAEAVGVEGYYSSEAPLLQSAGRPRLMASQSNDGVKMYVEGGFTASVGVDPDFRFEWIRQKRNGRSYQKWAILGSLKVSGSVGFEGTVGVKYHKTLPSIIGMSIPTGIPGVTVRSTGKVFFEADAHATGSYKASGEVTGSIQLGRERYDREDWRWLPPFDIGGTGTLQGDIEGSVSARVGFVPSFAVKLLETASVKVEPEAYAKFEVKASAKAPAEATLFNGVDISFSANAIDWDFGWLDVQVGAKGTLEGPRHEVAKWIAPDPDFDYTPNSGLEAPATVNFINQSKGTTIRILRTEWVAEPKEFEWDFGNGTCSIYQTAVNPTATYSSKGKYDVYLRAKGLITGPYRKKKTIKVGEKDDDDGEEDPDDDKSDTGKKSWDPNEVAGPLGVGEARYVKPG